MTKNLSPLSDLPARPLIVYVFAIFSEDGEYEDREPCVAWRSAEEARAAAVSYLADRSVAIGEADELLEWQEHVTARDVQYSTFTAPTKYGREVRVWPIEVMDRDEEAQ